MLTLENESSFIRRRKTYSITGQKMWISNAGFCRVFIVLHVLVMIKNTGFIVENDPSNGITMNEEEHKLELELLLVKFSSTKQKFLLKTCYQRGNGFKIAMNALNVGRISCCCLS
jgi:alkylation response protein AidB-like acyl-CoA dehydrogenase